VNTPQDLITSYVQWLKQQITVRELDGWVQFTTPFLDRHNDYMQIYVRSEGEHLTLTDDGYVLNDLALSGCEISTPRRRELLEQIIRGFGVQLNQDELMVRATKSTFAQRKHSLLQAMMSVNDLFLTTRSTVRGLFFEEVEQFLLDHQIRFVPSVQVAGRSGLSHTFDYVIPGWNKAPERIVKAINSPTKEKVQSMLFAWSDIRELRKRSQFYAMVNDTERSISTSVAAACEDQGVQVIRWSQRKDYVPALSA
jgi:hypothetical protein